MVHREGGENFIRHRFCRAIWPPHYGSTGPALVLLRAGDERI
jgi:hypothetical protein